MIPVTKPYLPKREKYFKLINEVFDRDWLTNSGPLLLSFEEKLKEYLDLDDLLVVNNGTVALSIALKALGVKGEVITTPFSYVATTSSIVWEGCQPVFVDIDEDSYNIDPHKIEEAITANTTAILATHCFGNACDIDMIERIAKKHNLNVIYDAAHCFGTKYKGQSILNFGDVSALSLHATKIMHSVEGGVLVSNDINLIERMAYMRNFGHDGPEKFNGVGINGKNSELHAAMGLCVLEDFQLIAAKRKKQYLFYKSNIDSSRYRFQKINELCEPNYSYFSILCENEEATLRLKEKLELQGVFPRRYFYPSLNYLDYLSGNVCDISDRVSSSILCLPMYFDMSEEEQLKVISILND